MGVYLCVCVCVCAVPTPSTVREREREETVPLLTMRFGFGIAHRIVERNLQARINRQQMIPTSNETGHMLLESQILALQLMQTIQQRSNCAREREKGISHTDPLQLCVHAVTILTVEMLCLLHEEL